MASVEGRCEVGAAACLHHWSSPVAHELVPFQKATQRSGRRHSIFAMKVAPEEWWVRRIVAGTWHGHRLVDARARHADETDLEQFRCGVSIIVKGGRGEVLDTGGRAGRAGGLNNTCR